MSARDDAGGGPLFSVILPTYNRAALLAEAVASVLRQTVEEFECLVVDDGSPNSFQLPRDPRVRVIARSSNSGPAASRNTGLRAARGRYVTFLDDDDLYTPDRLALALEGLRRAPITVCWLRFLDAPEGRNRVLDGDVRDTILEDFAPHVGVTAVARELVPLFDERFLAAEDAEWWIRLASRGPVSTTPRVGYLLRRHPEARHLLHAEARVEGRRLLLQVHASYFATRPRAAGFQWKRLGHLARISGDFKLARAAFVRALRLRPELRSLWHLLACLRPSARRPGRREPLHDR
ncbi:MAG: glycosyltransferase family 2 protein [Armatimonadota bacterium]|nr:glycosyltransferase family 2 protein [Armatimonadota bacterium]MDR7421386.1 glycosyltransferase family 2 protein [Armatimonadota bacterium]MDR7453903.1 glycosyltransferase family 2 protein [Armatimonadota bacterium]MDR7456676.1 glycosyltransferase family 2 protein [Armatimonadota bacterium]MDR7495729.1 glycosyltransferase family 2 protein [Armatimonadota bacterium]